MSTRKIASKDNSSEEQNQAKHNEKGVYGSRMKPKRHKSMRFVQNGKSFSNASITELVCAEVKQSKPKRINLSMDNMLAASKALSKIKNERVLDMSSFPGPVKNYVNRVIDRGDVDGELNKLNEQIVAKIGTEFE